MDRIRISSDTELRNWLLDQSGSSAQAIASRASLRVLPLLAANVFEEQGIGDDDKLNCILNVFRANFISWVALRHPGKRALSGENEFARSANDSALALRTFLETHERLNPVAQRSMAAALYAANATEVWEASDIAEMVAGLAGRTVQEAVRAAASLPKNEASETMWRSVEEDANALVERR